MIGKSKRLIRRRKSLDIQPLQIGGIMPCHVNSVSSSDDLYLSSDSSDNAAITSVSKWSKVRKSSHSSLNTSCKYGKEGKLHPAGKL